MNTMTLFLQGKKTWIGLILMVLGRLGLGNFLDSEQAGQIFDAVMQIVGIVLAIYGNHKKSVALKTLGGYAAVK